MANLGIASRRSEPRGGPLLGYSIVSPRTERLVGPTQWKKDNAELRNVLSLEKIIDFL